MDALRAGDDLLATDEHVERVAQRRIVLARHRVERPHLRHGLRISQATKVQAHGAARRLIRTHVPMYAQYATMTPRRRGADQRHTVHASDPCADTMSKVCLASCMLISAEASQCGAAQRRQPCSGS